MNAKKSIFLSLRNVFLVVKVIRREIVLNLHNQSFSASFLTYEQQQQFCLCHIFISHSSSEVSIVSLHFVWEETQMTHQRRRTPELTKQVSNSELSSSSSQEIPMNFIDPKELDIPNHGTKNRYKTILPSE